MTDDITRLREIFNELDDLERVDAILSWDQQVNMPELGEEGRSHQQATIKKIIHQKLASDKVGKLIDRLMSAGLEPDSDEAALVRVASRKYERETRLPARFVEEMALARSLGYSAWTQTKGKSDFASFRPHLERLVELKKEYITFFPPAEHPYDVLLDEYEPGMKTSEVKAIFNVLRPRQVELIQAIAGRPQVKDAFLCKRYDNKKLWDFSVEIVTSFGYEWTRGRQDIAPHPFETTFGPGDVRITTRFEKEKPPTMIFSSMHEAGHAMYEQGVDPKYARTPLQEGASLALHESQSRMWENLVGRSLPFWEYFYPRLKERFPSQLHGVGLKSFYKGINKVEPSFIRVNADEATYNLHIMLRLEIEIGLMEGAISVRDLPEVWNAKMQEYLGVTPPNHAVGVMQDVHWSEGYVGYFSTYALGNLVSAQLWEKIRRDIHDLDDEIRRGNFESLLDWLRKNLHRHGKKYQPQVLIEKITGSKISPEPYIRYLTKKYSEIYGL